MNKLKAPKPNITGQGTFKPPNPKTLNNSCAINDYVQHGDKIGILLKLENNTATIRLNDGTIKDIQYS